MYLKGFSSTIEVNRVSRDGGGTKHAVVVSDVGAYQFLLLLSEIVPGAIKRKLKAPLTFTVQNGPLLWSIRDYIEEEFCLSRKVSERVGEWGEIGERRGRKLRDHQVDALNSMKSRHELGKSNNFLSLSVGAGKTLIVLKYLEYLFKRQELCDYVVYTLPGCSIGSIIQECEAMGFGVVLIDPRKTIPKNASHYEYRVKSLRENFRRGFVSLIEHDNLRRCEDILVNLAPDCVFVVDEVHKALNETKRTSVALEISRLSHEVIALTGTPIIDTHTYKLAWWLKQICEFEVTERNFWVAASGMIAKKYNPSVNVIRESVHAKLNPVELERYVKLVPQTMGGKNSQAGPREYVQAMNICYDAVTREMVEKILRLLPKGGVFVVGQTIPHVNKLRDGLLKRGACEEDIFVVQADHSVYLTDDAVKSGKIRDYRVVITTIAKSMGYTLSRLKFVVTSVYPSNNATREQLDGRVVRMGQRAKEVYIYTVHTGVLTYIMQRHCDARNISEVLKRLADDIKSS